MQKAGPSGMQLIKKTITVAVFHTSIKRNLLKIICIKKITMDKFQAPI